MLDYNDGDAGAEQADAQGDEDAAALQQAADAAAAAVEADAAADGAADGAAQADAAAEVSASWPAQPRMAGQHRPY